MTDKGAAPILLADIGATNARFALSRSGVGDGGVGDAAVLACDDFASLTDAAGAYLEGLGDSERPTRAAVAVASPVTGDAVTMTNRAWSFSIDRLRRDLRLDDLRVINDFAAIALALPHLTEEDRLQVGGGRPVDGATIAVIGPGSGLGVSALVPTGGGGKTNPNTWLPLWLPLATEGGHVTMAAANDREAAVLAYLRKKWPHVSAERVVSGPGLVNLYGALCHLDDRAPKAPMTPAAIVAEATAGTCRQCVQALDMFAAMLATAAADLALSLGARGGVYIAGGIVPKLGPAFAASPFRQRFEDKGRFSDTLAAIPTYVITREMPALLGLRAMMEDRGGFS